MTTATPTLSTRTPEAIERFNLKPADVVFFHANRPPVIHRTNTGLHGISLEYSFTGGRNWQIVSFHDTVPETIEAFHDLGLGKDREPTHYRILRES
jgi:hypothetical protein